MPSRRCRRLRRRKDKPRPPRERQDWSELPLDAISYVLGKLDVAELLAGGAAGVCRSWRLAARQDPALWRHIDMQVFYRPAYRRSARPIDVARAAVRFAAGHCQEFWGMYDVDDAFLLFLSEEAPLLRSLRLSRCYKISTGGFSIAIQKFPLLEELELELCGNVDGKGVFELVSKACPQLKHLGHTKERYLRGWRQWTDDAEDYEKALAIARMHQLRSLQLYRIDLTNQGLAAILDGCTHLEYLDIRNCRNVHMDSALRAKCGRITTKKIRTFNCNDDDLEEFEPGSPISYCSTCCADVWSDRDSDLEAYCDDDDDRFDSFDDDYISGVDEVGLDEHERMMVDKSMRRYL